MKQRIIAAILGFSIVLGSFYPTTIYAQETQNGDIKTVSLGTEQESISPVLLDLLNQADDKYEEKEKITLIVEINSDIMSSKYGLNAPDISSVRTEYGLDRQIDYAKKAQEHLTDAFDDLGIRYTVTEYYDTVLTGIAVKTNYEDAKKIASLEEVKSVELNRIIPAPTVSENKFKMLDESSNNMINSGKAWSANFSGKGQLIAIIDSGADPNHEVFTSKPVDMSVAKIKGESDLKSKLTSEINAGKYFNDKIPFGFNYANANTTIKESKASSHGMHVAGIAAGNSDRLRGVAPDAQLLIMRVFGDGLFGGGTTPEIYNKAIDDAVKLGADSINMSLGSTGTTDSRIEKTTINALQRAQDAGIVVAIAMGNDGFLGFGALDGPSATNPDYGMTNSPGVADLSMAVASVDNIKIKQKGIILNTSPDKTRLFYLQGADMSGTFPTTEEAFVELGYGYEEDYANKDVSGKIALIMRGDAPGREKEETTFAKKSKLAQNKGAIAVIIYNNVEEDQLVSMAGFKEGQVTIPVCSISKKDGELLKKNQNLTISFETEESYVTNPNGYKLSVFSSWGVSPEGNLKPDISAPGGEIYSSYNDGTYGVNSGTSMASPHVAGGIAVVKEYVEKNINVQGREKHQVIKNLLMSTASPYKDKTTGAYFSPRGQGAGLMNLDRAISSKVVAIGTNGVSSINLRNIKGDKITVSGELKNYSREDKNFKYYATLNTDTVVNGRIVLKPSLIESTEANKKSIHVRSGETAKFEITFTLSPEKIKELEEKMPQGYFLEGYVFFENEDERQNINIPFVGFKGTWEGLEVIDTSVYEIANGKKPYYYDKSNIVENPFTHISTKVSGTNFVLGKAFDSTFENPKYDKNKIALSPNGDGRADYAAFVGTFLRNYKDFELSVVEKTETEEIEVYKTKQSDDFGIKNYIILGMGGPNTTQTKSHWKWSGKNFSDIAVKDGNYTLRVKVKPDGKSELNKEQITEFPLIVDTVHPRIVKSSYDRAKGEFIISALEENGSGIYDQYIKIDKVEYRPDGSGKFTLPAGTDPSTAVLNITDNAQNTISLRLDQAERTGNERSIIVVPEISLGSVPADMFKWNVIDSEGKVVKNPYDLKVGKYKLEIFDVQDPFEVTSPTVDFEVKENDRTVVVKVPFNFKNKKEVAIEVTAPRRVNMNLVLIDAETGTEYELLKNPSKTSHHVGYVPPGRYRAVIRNLTEGYFATISKNPEFPEGVDLEVYSNYVGIPPKIAVQKINSKQVPVSVERNGYNDEFTVVFRGKDMLRTTYEVKFEKGEDKKEVELPLKLPFEVYISNIKDTHGIDSFEYTGTLPVKEVKIKLVAGKANQNIPVDKRELLDIINRAKQLKEKDFEINSWSKFEQALDSAQKTYQRELVTQSEIADAIKVLQEAMDGLELRNAVDKSKLKAKIEEAEAIYSKLDDTYDVKTKEFLAAAIEGAKITYRSKEPKLNTVDHIEATIRMLDRAIANLKRIDGKVDKIQLENLMKKAEEFLNNKALYTDDSIEALQMSYDEAKEVLENKNANQKEVNEVAERLNRDILLMNSKADKSQLKFEIEKAEKIDLRKYELAGRQGVRTAIQDAKNVYKNPIALQKEIDDAIKTIKESVSRLVAINENPEFKEEVKIENKTGDDVDFAEFAPKAKVEQAGSKNRYTLAFNRVVFELNGMEFESNVTKLYIDGQEISGQKVGSQTQFTFELDKNVRTKDVKVAIDILEEFGSDPIDVKLSF